MTDEIPNSDPLGEMPEYDAILVDVETTGIGVETNIILEYGMQLSDLFRGKLGPSFAMPVWTEGWQRKLEADDFVNKMHTESGLKARLQEIDLLPEEQQSIYYLDSVEKAAIDWMAANNVPVREWPMVGSSVHFDRGFIEYYMPDLAAQFLHRNIDISTIKELCKRLNPAVYGGRERIQCDKKHRVLPDIADSMRELLYYQEEFFLW